ncbi:MAG: isoprenylcysteine carboxylmethyltransferase family protein [Bacteroidales bacterium]|nr:isoprenylcysteine carboxylmethyltransferase family protein [Bacteroidales bacterium]
MKDVTRHIIGYSIGIPLFAFVIPFGLYEVSMHDPLMLTDLNNHFVIRSLIALPFLIPGLIFMIWSNVALFRIGKGGPTDGFNIAISPRTKKLVIAGPYKYSRNPMVFGAFCIYFAIGLFMLSVTCVLVLFVFLFLSVYYLKHTEEKRLLRDFGDEYIQYKSQVPMIFPVRRK